MSQNGVIKPIQIIIWQFGRIELLLKPPINYPNLAPLVKKAYFGLIFGHREPYCSIILSKVQVQHIHYNDICEPVYFCF